MKIEGAIVVLAGRGCDTMRTARRLSTPVEIPLNNLPLALLHHRNGILLPSFVDSTGALEGLMSSNYLAENHEIVARAA